MGANGIGQKLALLAPLALAAALVHGASAEPAPQAPALIRFVAQPDQKEAVTALLTKQWGAMFAPCASIARQGDKISVAAPVSFDANGKPIQGAWAEQIGVSGCGASATLNVLTLVGSDGSLKHASLLPGMTMTDPVLQRDSLQYVRSALLPVIGKDCQNLRIVDTRFLGFAGAAQPDAVAGREKRPWNEEWTVRGCDAAAAVTIHYMPNSKGTAISTSPQETRKIEAK